MSEFVTNIEKIVYQGWGLSRLAGKIVFTPYTIGGETVKIKITEPGNHFSHAKLLEIIQPAPERVVPVCKYFTLCGGCHYQHIDYAGQLKIKREQVKESLQRVGKIVLADDLIKPTLPSPHIYHYRNKAVFHTFLQKQRVCLGYYADNGLIEIDNCPLLAAGLNQELPAILPRISLSEVPGEVVLRQDGEEKCHWLPNNTLPTALKVTLLGKKLKLDPGNFFQVNYHILPQFIELVVNACELTGKETVLDAYCGVGLFSLFLARKAKEVVGIEIDKQAVAYAKENARENAGHNLKFFAGDVEKVLAGLPEKFSVMILDPPRAGCSKTLLREIFRRAPRRIVYVSCDPVTLSRDLKVLTENHYTLTTVQPLDLFPQTFHIENIAVLNRF